MKKSIQTYIFTALLSTALIAFSANTAQAQLSNLHLQTKGLAQNNLENPALMPASSFVSMPFIGSLALGAQTPISSAELLTTRNGLNYINTQGLIKSLGGNSNATSLNLDWDLLNGGFFIGKNNYIGINLSTKIHLASNMPGDMLSLLADNSISQSQSEYNISLNPRVMSWAEMGVSYSRKLPLGFSVGARAKMLAGLVSVNSNSNFKVRRDYDQYIVSGDFDIQGGNINFNNVDANQSIANLGSNLGFGADIGAEWIGLDNRLRASIGVTDIGVINWSDESSTIKSKSNGEFLFNGMGDLETLLNGGDMTALMDSVSNAFIETIGSDTTSGKVRTSLPTTYQAYVEYSLGRKRQHVVSGAFQGSEILEGYFDYVLSAGYTYRSPSKRWQFMANYSYRPNSPYAVGIAGAYTSRGFQIYLGIDNIIPIFDLENAKQTSIKLAINFMIPSNRKQHKIRN